VPKRVGKYRNYTDADIDLLNLIKESKAFGMTISELQKAIQYTGDQIDWEGITEFLILQKKKINEAIESLRQKEQNLENCLSQINSCDSRVPLNNSKHLAGAIGINQRYPKS